MITANFIHRTFRIKCGNSIGTGFTIDVDSRQYLITAKHVVAGFQPELPLEIFTNRAWAPINCALVGHAAGETDVSVLASAHSISPANLPVIPSSDGVVYGQELYFLGFPFGVLSSVVFTNGYPLPLVKRALLSSFAGDVLLLDGHNNPGFSGGPVIFGAPGGMPNRIGAIISGYRFNQEPVLLNENDTGLVLKSNTGIMITYKIEVALDLIAQNPIGAHV